MTVGGWGVVRVRAPQSDSGQCSVGLGVVRVSCRSVSACPVDPCPRALQSGPFPEHASRGRTPI